MLPPPLPPQSKLRSPTLPSSLVTSEALKMADQTAQEKERNAAIMNTNQSQQQSEPFSPCFLFFYGSLMDPEVLQAALELSSTPIVRKGSITGFSLMVWGIYPTIIQNGNGKVSGPVWKINEEAQFLPLSEYETSAYTWCHCSVELDDGKVLDGCLAFCWAGDPMSKELEEGTFDLERYRRYFKASVVRNYRS